MAFSILKHLSIFYCFCAFKLTWHLTLDVRAWLTVNFNPVLSWLWESQALLHPVVEESGEHVTSSPPSSLLHVCQSLRKRDTNLMSWAYLVYRSESGIAELFGYEVWFWRKTRWSCGLEGSNSVGKTRQVLLWSKTSHQITSSRKCKSQVKFSQNQGGKSLPADQIKSLFVFPNTHQTIPAQTQTSTSSFC